MDEDEGWCYIPEAGGVEVHDTLRWGPALFEVGQMRMRAELSEGHETDLESGLVGCDSREVVVPQEALHVLALLDARAVIHPVSTGCP